MSSGPGKVQRSVLEVMAHQDPPATWEWVFLPDLTARVFDVETPSRAQVESVRRAAIKLLNAGRFEGYYRQRKHIHSARFLDYYRRQGKTPPDSYVGQHTLAFRRFLSDDEKAAEKKEREEILKGARLAMAVLKGS